METKIALFRGKGIRKTLHNNEWWFVINDVVGVLTDSADPSGYIKDMRRRDKELYKGWGQIATPLCIETPGGKQKINCANTEGVFRIIQSIPSPKAEPSPPARGRGLKHRKGRLGDHSNRVAPRAPNKP